MIDISLCCDGNMMDQAYAVIKSILMVDNDEHDFTFHVVRDCAPTSKELAFFSALRLNHNRDILVKFHCIAEDIPQALKDIFLSTGYALTPTWYRIFLPLLNNASKTIYLDCDLTVVRDISKLWQIDMKSNEIAGVKDFGMVYHVKRQDLEHKEYQALMKLKLKDPSCYLNGGVLLMDLDAMRKNDFINRCFEVMHKIPDMLYLDQDTVNVVCMEKSLVLAPTWNVISEFLVMKCDLKDCLSEDDIKSFTASLVSPSILHYAGPVKPWDDVNATGAELWWTVARECPFYERMLMQSIRRVIKASIFEIMGVKLNYLWSKCLVMLNQDNVKHQSKKRELKKVLRILKRF